MERFLDGRVALVTGAGPNIGSGIALALARYGAKVAVNDVNVAAAEATVNRIQRSGGTAIVTPGDVSKEEDVARYMDQIVTEWGRVDIVVNNAAILGGRALLEENVTQYNRAIEVAAAGNLLNTQYAAKVMIEQEIRGSIVCIVSSSGWHGMPGSIAYAFHKGGVINFVRAAAVELAPYGIRVNSYTPCAPTPDNPEFQRAGGGGGRSAPERPDWWRSPGVIDTVNCYPLGMSSTPTDIGHCVAWMCSDYARLITGCDFLIDGGANAKSPFLQPGTGGIGPVPAIPLEV